MFNDVALINWRILQSGRGERHFVGVRLNTGRSHTSSAISQLNLNAMTGLTCTGSYRLVGLPASDDTQTRIWAEWCAVVGVPSPFDVTAYVLSCRSRQTDYVGHGTKLCLFG